IRKNITIEGALAAAKRIKKHGIRLSCFFMVGFPQETEESLNQTIRAMKKIKCDSLVYSIFNPYPGTEAFDYCLQKGLIDQDIDLSLYSHQSSESFFIENMDYGRFREMASSVEAMVDRKNRINNFRRNFSLATLDRARKMGLWASLKRAKEVVSGA
ncbi:MAG: hypothetical protein JRJ59_11310, partial [Deltaproteobacteria bacterium]|nr:hypothetical protein [Deltaproteobacteria bacterium]